MLINNILRKAILVATSLALFAALQAISFKAEGYTPPKAKQSQQTKEYRYDNFHLTFKYPASWVVEEWNAAEEIPYPEGIRYQIRLKTTSDEYVATISIFQRVTSLEDWLRESQGRNIIDASMNLDQAKAEVDGKQGYMWSTLDGQGYLGFSLAVQGDLYLYYIDSPASGSVSEEVLTMINSLRITSSQEQTEMAPRIQSPSETLSDNSVPSDHQASNPPLRAALEHPNGWLYPAGSSNYLYLSWLCYNSAFSGYHLAQDMANPQGDPVYAVDSGDVIYSSPCVGGYGGPSGGSCGGALVIRHRAKDGTWFTALYGHLDSPHPIGHVYFGDIIGYSNNWNPPHVHFGVRLGPDVADANPYRGYTPSTSSLFGFTKPVDSSNSCGTGTGFLDTYYACRNGSSVDFRPNNNAPVHPNGTLIKSTTDGTVYLIRNGQKQGIVSVAVLRNLYPNGGFDFKDVITVAQDEWNSYPTGSVITSQLPSNGRTHAEGRLIRRSTGGEISIVSDNGTRRPFVSSSVFLNLGYLFCNVVDATDSNYDSYPVGAPITGTGGGATAGTIQVNATLNGSSWSGAVSYSLSGASSFSGSSVPSTFGNKPTGSYTLSYSSGGPSGATLSNITPSSSQTLGSGSTISFTLNFTSSGGGGVTTLSNNVPVSDAVTQNQQKHYKISVPSGATQLNVQLTGSGDADLYVRYGSQASLTAHDCRPYLTGSNETCTFSTPQAGDWYIMIHGYASGTSSYTLRATYTTGSTTGSIQVNATLNGSSWSGAVSYSLSGASSFSGSSVPSTFSSRPTGSYTLSYSSGGPSGATLSSITPTTTQTLPSGGTISFTLNFTSSGGGGVTTLSNNVPVSDAVTQNQQKHYKISVPSGATQLTVQITGSGDADLYVRYGSQASLSSFDCRPYLNGSNETCTFSTPQSGDWYIMIHGYASGTSSYTLRATYTTGSTTGSIQVNATLNGSSWSGAVSYSLSGASSFSGSSVPSTFSSRPTGSYTLSYSSGGPSGATLSSITPTTTQTLPSGGTISFTLNFTSSGGGGVTTLSNNVPVSDAVTQNQQKHYKISVPSGATQLNVQLTGSGDADLYVRYGSQASLSTFDCRPYLNGSNETCTFSTPQAGDWYIMIHGYASGSSSYTLRATYTTGGGTGTGTIQVNGTLNGGAWSGSVNYSLSGAASLTGTAVPASGQNVPVGSYTLNYNSGGPSGATLSSITPTTTQTLSSGSTITFTLNFTSSGSGGITTISNGQAVSDSVQQGQQKHYRIAVPSGATNLRIEITGTNDADLYVKYGSQASFTNYDCRPYLIGSNEACVAATPAPGDYYIMIDGYGTGSSAYTLIATYTGGSASATISTSVLNPPAIIARIRIGAMPEGLTVSKDGRLIYVVNYRDQSVNIVDAESLTVISTIEIESGGAAIVLSPNETKAYVTNELSDSLSIINLQNRQTITIPTGSKPHGLAISPDGRRLYVCNMGDNSLGVFDTETLRLVREVEVGINPFNVVVSPDGRWVYVANSSEADPGSSTLSLVDTGALMEVARIVVGTRVRGLGLSADGSRLYYSQELNNQISVFDTSSRDVTERFTAEGSPYALGLTLNGSTLWSADVDSHTVTSYDTANGQRLTQIDLGEGATPHAIALAPDGRRIYTTNSSGNELVVLDNETSPTLKITSASMSGKHLIVNGAGFDNGAKVLIDGVQLKTINDETNPTTTLIGKKAKKRIARGQTVVVMVRNPDGSLSNGFNFTRP